MENKPLPLPLPLEAREALRRASTLIGNVTSCGLPCARCRRELAEATRLIREYQGALKQAAGAEPVAFGRHS